VSKECFEDWNLESIIIFELLDVTIHIHVYSDLEISVSGYTRSLEMHH